MIRSLVAARKYDDRGFVAGAEMLLFGVFAFVMGSLLIVNVWNVIDSSLAVSAASREGVRTFQEATPDTAWSASQVRVMEVLEDYNRSDRALTPQIDAASFERCGLVTVTAEYQVALVRIPLFGQFGTMTKVSSTHSGLIDGYRSGDFGGSCS